MPEGLWKQMLVAWTGLYAGKPGWVIPTPTCVR
jgi:hypothetical protein